MPALTAVMRVSTISDAGTPRRRMPMSLPIATGAPETRARTQRVMNRRRNETTISAKTATTPRTMSPILGMDEGYHDPPGRSMR